MSQYPRNAGEILRIYSLERVTRRASGPRIAGFVCRLQVRDLTNIWACNSTERGLDSGDERAGKKWGVDATRILGFLLVGRKRQVLRWNEAGEALRGIPSTRVYRDQ